jgi:hypothetical protein
MFIFLVELVSVFWDALPPFAPAPVWSEGEEIVYAFSVTSYSFLHVREGL